MRIKFLIITILLVSSVFAQENNSSISDELKEIWGSDNGMYTDPSSSNILGVATEDLTLPGGGTNTQEDAPIDGGLGFLLAAGVGYYANGVRKRRRQKNQNGTEGKDGDK